MKLVPLAKARSRQGDPGATTRMLGRKKKSRKQETGDHVRHKMRLGKIEKDLGSLSRLLSQTPNQRLGAKRLAVESVADVDVQSNPAQI